MKFKVGDLVVSTSKGEYLFTETPYAIFRVEKILGSDFMSIKLFSFINEELYYREVEERAKRRLDYNKIKDVLKEYSLRDYPVKIDCYKLYNPEIIWD